jgi:murein DD-endopeptidase MepM/ murein hydrolase activator NlpD
MAIYRFRPAADVTALACVFALGCPTREAPHDDCDRYTCATAKERATFKRIRLPFSLPISFEVHQGAFGSDSHDEPGNEYSWDLDVPYGTPVLAIEGGQIIDVYEPAGGGGCEARLGPVAHNVKVQHADGTVAQYVHVAASVSVGQQVTAGEQIAVTEKNGFICTPHLHLGVYRSRDQLYASPKRETIPLLFEGVEGGVLVPGEVYRVEGSRGSP